ncbi:MAG: hypothetical protein Q9208_006245 [Pyrenodesmia sp. 3 TL-2023]
MGCHGIPKRQYKNMKTSCKYQLGLGDKKWRQGFIDRCFTDAKCEGRKKRDEVAAYSPPQDLVKKAPKEWEADEEDPTGPLLEVRKGGVVQVIGYAVAPWISGKYKHQGAKREVAVVGCHSKVKDFYWHNRQICDGQTGKMSKYSVEPYGWQVNQTLVDLCFHSVGCPSGRNIAFGGCTAETNTYYYQNYTVDPSIPNAERCLGELYKGSKNVPDEQRHYDRDLIDTCFTNPNCPKRDVVLETAGDQLEKQRNGYRQVEKREAVAGTNHNGLPKNAACILNGTCKPGQQIGLPAHLPCAVTGTCSKRDAMPAAHNNDKTNADNNEKEPEPVADPFGRKNKNKDKTKPPKKNIENVDPINFSGTGEF